MADGSESAVAAVRGRERGRVMRQRGRIDANQREIVAALRAVGCSVESLAQLGGGVPDLLVGRGGVNYLLEVKDGLKPPSRRVLTDDEAGWHRNWRGGVVVVKSVSDALRAVGVVTDLEPKEV